MRPSADVRRLGTGECAGGATTLTAEENVTLPLRIASKKVDEAWLDAVLQQVGLNARNCCLDPDVRRRPAASTRCVRVRAGRRRGR